LKRARQYSVPLEGPVIGDDFSGDALLSTAPINFNFTLGKEFRAIRSLSLEFSRASEAPRLKHSKYVQDLLAIQAQILSACWPLAAN
jgi:hypothetical protein